MTNNEDKKPTLQELSGKGKSLIDVTVSVTNSSGKPVLYIHVSKELVETWKRFVPKVNKETITLKRDDTNGIKPFATTTSQKANKTSFRIAEKYSTVPFRTSKMRVKTKATFNALSGTITMDTPLILFKTDKELELLRETREKETKQVKSTHQKPKFQEEEEENVTPEAVKHSYFSLEQDFFVTKVQELSEDVRNSYKLRRDAYDMHFKTFKDLKSQMDTLEEVWDLLNKGEINKAEELYRENFS